MDDGACRVHECTQDVLNSFDASVVKLGRVVVGLRELLLRAVCDLAMLVRQVLWLGRGLVSFAKEKVADVVGHGEAARAIAVAGGIVPFNVDAGKLFAFPVLRHLIVLIEDAQEVVGVFASDIFDAKVVDDEDELDRAPYMLPEAWSCVSLVVSCLFEPFVE